MRAVVLAALTWPPLCALVFFLCRNVEVRAELAWSPILAWIAAQGALLVGLTRLVDARSGMRDAGGDRWIAAGLALNVGGQFAAYAVTSAVEAIRSGTWVASAPLVLIAVTGAWQWSLAEVAIASRREPSLDAADAAVRSLAAALATTHPALWIVMVVMVGDKPSASTLWIVTAGILPGAAALPSALRLIARKRWLARVAAGRVEGWRIEEATSFPDVGGLVPLGPSWIVGRPAVLVAASRAAGPFRAAGRGIAVAVVPLRG